MALNPLQQAILDGDTESARRWATQRPELLQSATAAGMSVLALARAKGFAATIVAMIRAGAPGAETVTDWRDLLRTCLGDLSQDHVCAGWLDGLEFLVWRAVVTREPMSAEADPLGFSGLPLEQLRDVEWLAGKCGGWWADEQFIAMPQWRKRYEDWRRGSGGSGGSGGKSKT